MKYLASIYLIIFHFFIAFSQPIAPSKKDLARFVQNRTYAPGLKLSLHSSVNLRAFYMAYHSNPRSWDTAFAFLRDQDLEAIKPGKYFLLGDSVFVTVTEAATKPMDSIQWESHKKYIDLQYIFKGKEKVGVADAATAKITKPYSFDAMNYEADGKFYISDPTQFFLFFPNDAHRPSIRVAGFDTVKKFVIKIMSTSE